MTEADDAQREQDPDIINLVVDQIEFCNMILLNKCDLLSPQEVESVRKTIRIFQKDADICECTQGKINPDRIFNDQKFDYEKVLQASRVQEQLLRKEHEIQDEHGITSFLFEEKRPFDRAKWMSFLENAYPEEIIRAKGYLWFSDDPSATAEMYAIIRRLNREEGITVLMISHDVFAATREADHILHLAHRPLFFGNTEDYRKSDVGRAFLRMEEGERA